jgi:hypothetical protein
MCFYDDELNQIKLPTSSSGDINFGVAFQLLGSEQDRSIRDSWLARVGTCARVALMDAGLQEQGSFTVCHNARPSTVVSLIAANRFRLRKSLPGHRGGMEENRIPSPSQESQSRRDTQSSPEAADADDQEQAPEPSASQLNSRRTPISVRSNSPNFSEDEDDIMDTAVAMPKPSI